MNPFVPPIKTVAVSEYSALDASATPPAIYFKVALSSSTSHWYVWHRYSEFYEFHQTLKTLSVVIPALLPSRTFIRPPNLEQRRAGLESYLKSLIQFHADLRGFWSLECVHSFFSIPSSSPFYKRPRAQFAAVDAAPRSALVAASPSAAQERAARSSEGSEEQAALAANATLLSAQDSLLDSLSESLRRQKDMGLLMGSEIESQNLLLDDLSAHVDRTKSKVSRTARRVQKIL